MYIGMHVEINNDGRLRTKLNDKRDYFCFSIVNIYFYVATFKLSRHIDLLSFDIPELEFTIMCCCFQESYLTKGLSDKYEIVHSIIIRTQVG